MAGALGNIQYWWVTASIEWHWDDILKDYTDPKKFEWGGEEWIKSPVSFARIKKMRRGDIAVAYQAKEGVIGLGYLMSNGYQSPDGCNYNTFDLKPSPRVRLNRPVPYAAIRESKNADRAIEFVRVNRGSVLGITPDGFDTLISLMVDFNPEQKRDIMVFLGSTTSTFGKAGEAVIDSYDEMTSPLRKDLFTQRIVRDGNVVKQLKEQYRYECQICGETIELPNGKRYAETHHLRPVGAPHNGKDGKSNILVVCPQHHAMLDLGVIALNPKSLIVEHWKSGKGTKLKSLKHKLREDSLSYHYTQIYKSFD